jgi:hypothetical protein
MRTTEFGLPYRLLRKFADPLKIEILALFTSVTDGPIRLTIRNKLTVTAQRTVLSP